MPHPAHVHGSQRVGKVSGELGQACLISPTLRRVGESKHKIAC